ncbi:MAG: DNA topoisomerase VI subunit B [Candidatus Thermoplasmatota archaeon]|nr:DNA topoisomerase VI subunit B [Candidatus Thermoplasmatota archaeon]
MTGEKLFSQNREISISEFFNKNRHILGFESPQKSLFMIVKEAVDNSLDACEEYGILPEIEVIVQKADQDEFIISVEDNGPGINRKEVANVFGKLLYGSRFHQVRQSRGQQGIGITAAVFYGQITTGKHAVVETRIPGDDLTYRFEVGIDVKTNSGIIFSETPGIKEKPHGTKVTIHARGKYQEGKQSILEYLRETAAVNPDMDLKFTNPEGKTIRFQRTIDELPKKAVAVKPHPYGTEIGDLQFVIADQRNESITQVLQNSFSRMSRKSAGEVLANANVEPEKKAESLSLQEIRRIVEAFATVKIMPPQTDCLSPLGIEYIRRGLRNVYEELKPSFYSKPVTRNPIVYKGNPIIVEVGLVYGGDLSPEEPIRIVRYANKVPLLYQQGACAITKAVSEFDWRQFGLEQRSGAGIPFGPMILLVHVCGTKIPYSSESKEAIAQVPEIVDEIKQALRISARSLRTFMRKRERRGKANEKYRLVAQILPEISAKSAKVLGLEPVDTSKTISRVANVVLVRETVEKDVEGFSVKCSVTNYTKETWSFKLHIAPASGKSSLDTFEVKDLQPAATQIFSFTVNSDTPYSETEYYVEGIDPVYVIGAEALPPDFHMREISYEVED